MAEGTGPEDGPGGSTREGGRPAGPGPIGEGAPDRLDPPVPQDPSTGPDAAPPGEPSSGPTIAGAAEGPSEPWAVPASRPTADEPPDLGPRPPSPEEARPFVVPGRPAPRRRGGVGALLLGGALAAAVGFGAAWAVRDRWDGAADAGRLAERVTALEARPAPADLAPRLADAEARLDAVEEGDAGASPDLAPLQADLAALADRAADLDARLAALEARSPPADPSAAPAPGRPADPPAVEAPAADPTAPLGSLAGAAADRSSPPPAVTEEDVAALEARLAAAEAALQEEAADPAAPPAATEQDVAALQARLDEVAALEDRLAAAEAALAALGGRVGEAEAASVAAGDEARRIAEEAAAAQARADAAAAEARARAALATVAASLEAGEPYAEALEPLGPLGLAVPPGLAAPAAEGAPTLAALQEAFPAAARAGLAAAREAGLTQDGGRLTSFLSSQLGLRSVSPRAGDDPDAVLSRAEAALRRGLLPEALAAVEALPEPALAAMGPWVADARARAAADDGLRQLRDALPDT